MLNYLNSTKIPDGVYVYVYDSRNHIIHDLLINLEFLVNYKNNYNILLTKKYINKDTYFISKNEIIDNANITANSFLMDYVNIEEVFNSSITINIMSSEDAQRAIEGYHFWINTHSHLFYENYINDLKYHLEKTKELEASGEINNLRIECWTEPKDLVTFEILPYKKS